MLRDHLCGAWCLIWLSACNGWVHGAPDDANNTTNPARTKLDAAVPKSSDSGVTDEPDAARLDAGLDVPTDASQAGGGASVGMAGGSGNAGRAGGPSSAGRAASGGAGAAGVGGVAGSDLDAGDKPAACSGMFCEDFESGSLRSDIWTRKETSNGNSVQVQTSRVAHGQYAAQFHAKGGTATSMVLLENLPTALSKHYFGRLYYYATNFPSESGGHTAYITSSNTLSGFPYSDHHLEVASYNSSNNPIWQMTYWTGDGPEYINSGGQIPKAQWFCLEWEFNDAPDEIGIWVDGDGMTRGAAFRNINKGATNLLGKMTTLGVGFRTWHPMGAPDIDVYIDDIVLDDKRVGCL